MCGLLSRLAICAAVAAPAASGQELCEVKIKTLGHEDGRIRDAGESFILVADERKLDSLRGEGCQAFSLVNPIVVHYIRRFGQWYPPSIDEQSKHSSNRSSPVLVILS